MKLYTDTQLQTALGDQRVKRLKRDPNHAKSAMYFYLWCDGMGASDELVERAKMRNEAKLLVTCGLWLRAPDKAGYLDAGASAKPPKAGPPTRKTTTTKKKSGEGKDGGGKKTK